MSTGRAEGLVCAPTTHPGLSLVGEPIGALCPFCHHSNVVHDMFRNVCVLCDLAQTIARWDAPRRDSLQPNLVDQSLMRARGLDIAIAMAEGFEHAQFAPERRAAWAAWYTEWTAETARRGRVMGVPE